MTSQESGTGNAAPRSFDRRAAFRSLALSLTINALFPYLLFRYLEPHYPEESVLPLLYSSLFPVFGFLLGVWRKRMVDMIALIALVGIAIHIGFTVFSPTLAVALVLRSLQGAIIGIGFLVSVVIGHPVMLYVARRFVAAGAPERRARFDAFIAKDNGRVFRIAPIVWGVGLTLMSGVHVALAMSLPHDEFVLVSPVLGVVTDVILVGWSIRYVAKHVTARKRGTG
jgi:hypothetical protein